MEMKKIIIALFLIAATSQCHSQPALIGNWRRVIPEVENQDLKTKQLQPADLQIFSDSTFHIQGDTTSQNSKVPGWHSVEDYRGTWEQKGVFLTLRIEPKKDMMFLTFKIVEVTKEKLILKIPSDESTGRPEIRYVRL